MTKIWQFPTFPIEKQLFRAPGSAFDGGLTSGGAQLVTPEPGGFGVLEIEPSVQLDEWDYPMSSWLMSKTNGQVFRVRLAPTPQIAFSQRRGNAMSVPWDNGEPWSNQENWEGDFSAVYSAPALKGSLTVEVDLTGVGPILQQGHVIGHEFSAYGIDEIEYDGDTASITLNLPLRRAVAIGDQCPLRPWFTGRIVGDGFKSMYEAKLGGHIKMGTILMYEAVVP
jgi:hypothetical protein|tara:strand:+ start:1190 stop:1861 length:672 start_codon:yes stop_codon:yes gene_type:complete